MTHTPGPWEYIENEDGTFGVKIDGGHELLYHLEGSCPECFANMHLIAVTPELLEACEDGYGVGDVPGILRSIANTFDKKSGWNLWLHRKASEIEAAIAKAKGKAE